MSNSTYCEDHYEQPDWMKKIQVLEKQNKELRELLAKKEKEYIDKEIIRKEVERLRNLHQMKYQQLDADNSMSLVECGKRNLCNELLRFIDSMKEEPISEDERIRKWLISYFKEVCDNVSEKEKNGVLAWLEKQVEQKPNFCHHEVDLSDCSEEYRKAYYDGWNNCNMQHSQCKSELDDVVKCLINGMKFYYEDNEEATWGTDKWSMPVKHIIEVLEKQSEQKPTDKVEQKFKVGDKVLVDGKVYTIKLVNEDNYIVDENGRDVQEHFSYTKDWKLYEQKPTAWSEEDETRFKSCIKILQTSDGYDTINTKWLKSIRYRSQWKPSDEQMEALKEACDEHWEPNGLAPLYTLYQNLKELK